jgi:hypothetical protein
MGYVYPPEFPRPSRARIEAAKIRAASGLEETKAQLSGVTNVEAEIRKYVLQVFAAFTQEALALGQQAVWDVERVDREVREFLSCFALEAQLQKGYDSQGRPTIPLTDRVFGRILPEVRLEFEKSAEWRRYQEDLLNVAQVCASGAAIGLAKRGHDAEPRHALGTGGALAGSSGGAQPKSRRRNTGNNNIDNALREIAMARPASHEEVFRGLDGRVKPPHAKPFATTGGWMSGFRADKAAARAWLSKAWSRLSLPPFRRGPK